MQKILIVGVSGMLGQATYRLFAASPEFRVTGTARSSKTLQLLPRNDSARIVEDVDISDVDALSNVLAAERPDIVINCVGVIKQLEAAKNPLTAIATNALFPHRLAQLCTSADARLVQISTDCVFSGRKGNYRESDYPDADDLYGRTKLLGEVDYPNAITLRTSIIGHERATAHSLIDWFLSQPGPEVRGYRKAIYSGLPTVELARVIRDVVIPRPGLTGLWHLSSDPINKYELLRLVAKTYNKSIEILPDDSVDIDRSLDGSRFRDATGYVAAPWDDLVKLMHASRYCG